MTAKRTINGLTVIEAPPDAPLPEDVPSWAERCDVVEVPASTPGPVWWMAGAGAVGALGSVLTLAFVSHWGMAPLPLSLVVLLWFGLRPGITPAGMKVIPSPTGRYLAYENIDEDNPQAPLRPALLILVGSILVVGAVALLVAGVETARNAVSYGVLGLAAILVGLIGGGERDAEEPASLRFRALADPARFHTKHDPLAPRLSPSGDEDARRDPLRDAAASTPERVAEPRA